MWYSFAMNTHKMYRYHIDPEEAENESILWVYQNAYRKFVFRVACCVFGQNFRPTEAPLAPTHKYASIEKSTRTSYPHILNKNPLRLSDRNFGPEFRVYIVEGAASIAQQSPSSERGQNSRYRAPFQFAWQYIIFFYIQHTHCMCDLEAHIFHAHDWRDFATIWPTTFSPGRRQLSSSPPPVPAISLAVQKSQWGFRPYVRIHPGGLGRKELKDALVLPRTGDCVYIVVGGWMEFLWTQSHHVFGKDLCEAPRDGRW